MATEKVYTPRIITFTHDQRKLANITGFESKSPAIVAVGLPFAGYDLLMGNMMSSQRVPFRVTLGHAIKELRTATLYKPKFYRRKHSNLYIRWFIHKTDG